MRKTLPLTIFFFFFGITAKSEFKKGLLSLKEAFSNFIVALRKLVVIVVFMLAMLVFASSNCLAQDKQTTQYHKDKLTTMRTLDKYYKDIGNQMTKLIELAQDTNDIAKNVRDTKEQQDLIDLKNYIEFAMLKLEAPRSVISLYTIVIFNCEPDSSMKSLVQDTLSLKEQYEFDLKGINLILSYTKNPTVVSQCNQAKNEIRNCINILEKTSEFFK